MQKTYYSLKDYFISHHVINEIIIIDNHSTDGTREFLQNYNPNGFKIIFFDNELSEKKCLITALEQSVNENIIVIEPELKTRLSQFCKVIKKLRKADIVLPNRFDHRSTCKGLNEPFIKGFISELLTGYVSKDPYNAFKGFKRALLLPILRNTRSERFYWLEAIKSAKKEGLRINEPPTNYNAKKTIKKNQLMSNISELLRIKKIK